MSALPAAQADTYPKMLRLNAREHGSEIALREKDLGLWRLFTWNDYQARVRDFALGLLELGLGRGDVIGIIGDNRPDWVAAEIATHAIGAMSLGLYRDVLTYLRERIKEVLTGAGAQIDTTTANGRLAFGIFAAFAEFERELIRARTEAATAPGAVQRMYSIFGSILDPNKEYTPLYARASKIRQETMLIWGRDDRMLPYEQAHFAFRQLPKAELHAFSRCGHWAMIEQKDKFERLVIDFLLN